MHESEAACVNENEKEKGDGMKMMAAGGVNEGCCVFVEEKRGCERKIS